MPGYNYTESQILIKQNDLVALKKLFYYGLIKEDLFKYLLYLIKNHSIRIPFASFEIEELSNSDLFSGQIIGESRIVILKGDIELFHKMIEAKVIKPNMGTYFMKNLGKHTTIVPLGDYEVCDCDIFE